MVSRRTSMYDGTHVRRDRADAKYRLQPVELARNRGFKELSYIVFDRSSSRTETSCSRRGMSSLAIDTLPRITDVEIDRELLVVHLDDGRILSVPLSWYPRLEHASVAERSNWQLFADGEAIEWPDVDEHIGIDGLIAGRRSQESRDSLRRWLRTREG